MSHISKESTEKIPELEAFMRDFEDDITVEIHGTPIDDIISDDALLEGYFETDKAVFKKIIATREGKITKAIILHSLPF